MATSWKSVNSDRPALPEYLARPGGKKMSKDDIQAVVENAIQESATFVDAELSPERGRATEYYLGKPFGNEEEGRSHAILTELRDAVDGMVPSLMRVFFGAEHAVEFTPTGADNVEQAAQKTDYVRYIFEKQNAGFLKALQVLKDGLIRKIGIFKWNWREAEEKQAFRYENVDEQQVQVLQASEGVEITDLTAIVDEDHPENPPLYDVDFTRVTKGPGIEVWALPPEEFLFNRQARDLDTALLIAHRTLKTRGELRAMGISAQDIDDHAGGGDSTDVSLQANFEELARRDTAGIGRTVGFGFTNDPDMGPENAKILYTEALMRMDVDGDGVPEWRHLCCIGPTFYVIENLPADGTMGFSIFTPYPEPHTLIGGSVADRTMDVQKINSSILRAMLDSLAASIFPRTVYLENQVSVPDILNTAIGAPIRERVQGSVRNLTQPFVGQQAMPVLAFMQDVVAQRIGRRVNDQGLSADDLQSTGKEAVTAVVSGAQEQLELVARVFAEMTLKPLFEGIGRLLLMKQPRKEMVRLRGQWVEVDPRSWDAKMDATVNVGLGTSFIDKKVATLMSVAQDQTNILTQLGPENPVVSLAMLRNTKAKILRLNGIQDVDSYYKPVEPNWQPPPPPPAPPSPEQMAMENEQQMNHLKAVKELAIEQDKLALEHTKFQWQKEFDLLNLNTNAELKRLAINAQFASTATSDQVKADVQRDLAEDEFLLKAHAQLSAQDGDAATDGTESGEQPNEAPEAPPVPPMDPTVMGAPSGAPPEAPPMMPPDMPPMASSMTEAQRFGPRSKRKRKGT